MMTRRPHHLRASGSWPPTVRALQEWAWPRPRKPQLRRPSPPSAGAAASPCPAAASCPGSARNAAGAPRTAAASGSGIDEPADRRPRLPPRRGRDRSAAARGRVRRTRRGAHDMVRALVVRRRLAPGPSPPSSRRRGGRAPRARDRERLRALAAAGHPRRHPPLSVLRTIPVVAALAATARASEWTTYRSERFGYEVSYPPGFELRVFLDGGERRPARCHHRHDGARAGAVALRSVPARAPGHDGEGPRRRARDRGDAG